MTNLKKLLLASGMMFLFSFSSVSAQNAPNLQMFDAELESRPSVKFNPRFTAAKSGRDEDDYFVTEHKPARGAQEKTIYPNGFMLAEVEARNTSAKDIKVVTWEFSFFSDAQMTQQLRSYKLRTGRKIPAGETKTLKEKIPISVAVSAQTLTNLHKKARPLRIEYVDGTVWEAP